jgi:hypothetical protein
MPLGAAGLSPQLRPLGWRQGVGGWGAAQLNPALYYNTRRPIAHVLVITKHTNPCVGHHQKYESEARARVFVSYETSNE